MKGTLLLAAVFCLVLGLMCLAQDAKPDFTGKWILDVAKSDFGPMPPPDSQTRLIDHKDPNLKATITQKGQQGERTYERNITTDGKENTNTFGQLGLKSKSRWDGKRLITEGKLETQNGTVEINEAQELNEDSTVLTIKNNFKSPQGEASQKLVFNKEKQEKQ